MPESKEIGEIKSPLASIKKKIGTFDGKTEFYSEETPLGNSPLQEFNAISKVSKICRMTGVDEEKWSKIENIKYSDYRSALVANNEYSGLISLNAMYICNLIDRGKYADASYMAIQIGTDIHPTKETLPEDYIRDDLDPNEALDKLREHLDRSLSDGKRKIALAFLKAGQIERADAVRGDPVILSPIDYLHYTLTYIRHYESVGDLTSAKNCLDDLTVRWDTNEHGSFPNYLRILVDDRLRGHSLALFESGKH